MDTQLAAALSAKGVKTRDDLADLAVDELAEMTGMDEEKAKGLIMAARAHWFADEAGAAGAAAGGAPKPAAVQKQAS
jgi:N utilization substance protein A